MGGWGVGLGLLGVEGRCDGGAAGEVGEKDSTAMEQEMPSSAGRNGEHGVGSLQSAFLPHGIR